jgi:uncharacterized membrane protein YidH (DUF202 family)
MSMLGAIVFGVGITAMTVFMYLDRNHAKPWHFWIAPVLSLVVGATLIQLAVGYYVKVGRLETKGRPRSE